MELVNQKVRLHLKASGHTDWLQQAEAKAPQHLKEQGLHIIKPLHGGAASIVLLAEDQQGERRVAKIMPPEDYKHQVQTLQTMDGQGVPRLISSKDGILVIEYIEGIEQPEAIKLEDAVLLIEQWNKPAPGMRPIKDQLVAWLKFARPIPGDKPEIHKAVDQAEKLLDELPGGDKLLHGDMGQHNLIQGTELWAIDPTGARGPIEADIAFLSFLWPGHPEPAVVEEIIDRLCYELNGDPELARGYAQVRATCSAGFGNNRGEQEFMERSLRVVEQLSS